MQYLPQFGQNIPNQVVGEQAPMDDAYAQLLLKRKLAQADALRNQQMPQGQMVSGHYVAPSWTQYLANAVGQYKGTQKEKEAMKEYGGYQSEKQRKYAEALADYENSLKPRTEQAPQQPSTVQGANGEIAPNMGMVNAAPRTLPATAADRYAALMKFAGATQNPELTQRAMLGNIEYANKQEDTASEREFQRIQQKDRQGFELTQGEKNFANQMALQKSNQGFQASENAKNRQNQNANQPLVPILDPATGRPKLVPRSQAVGAMPYTPAQEAKDIQKQKGAENFDTLIGGLRDSYTQLGKMGGITNTKQGPLSNLGAGIASSGIGQATGRMFGTEAQSIRNRIAQSRPLLLNAIKEATGMSAKQMDSNAELKMYLAAATDPTLDLQTNLNALAQLETLYGKGQSKAPGGNVDQNVVDFGSLK